MSEPIKDEAQTKIDETNPTDESLKADDTKEVDRNEGTHKHIPYDRFKAKVDEANALKEKLAEIERTQAEQQRKELEEQNEYKTLYEQALEQAEKAKIEALNVKKNAMLAAAGYGEEQTKLLSKLVEGESDEELSESIKLLQATIPVADSYGDPNAFNGQKDKPANVDKTEIGRNAVSRVLHKIRL